MQVNAGIENIFVLHVCSFDTCMHAYMNELVEYSFHEYSEPQVLK